MRGSSEAALLAGGAEGMRTEEEGEAIAFDWDKRWLRGHEYEYMLKHSEAYCQKFGFETYSAKSHPDSIYDGPGNGTIYFVRGTGLGSEFGFPRVPDKKKKKFRWKKMNFSTNLPKKDPRVTYIVASTTHSHSHQISDSEAPLYRMHAVVPFEEHARHTQGIILCHILEIKRRNEVDEISTCFSNGRFDFYRLFAFLHNLSAPFR